MYPDIPPKVRVKSTISHPLRSEEVIGFLGRNTLLGRTAIVMKEDALEGESVTVPQEASKTLRDDKGELIVLDGGDVLAMDSSDFVANRDIGQIEGRGKTATISLIDRMSEQFRSWDESAVEVGN